MAVKYWQEKQEALCLQWLSADTKQQYQIYDKLHPALQIMTSGIMKRYFSFGYEKQDLLFKECINEVFLRLKDYDIKKQKAYTYCSMLIKHYLYNCAVKETGVRRIHPEYVDDYSGIEDIKLYENNTVLDKPKLIRKLKNIELKMIHCQKKRIEFQGHLISEKSINIISEIIKICLEYVDKFDTFETYSVVEYCANKTGFTPQKVSHYFSRMFGIFAQPYNNKIDSKFHNGLDDDWCPNGLYRYNKNKGRAKNEVNKEKYIYRFM